MKRTPIIFFLGLVLHWNAVYAACQLFSCSTVNPGVSISVISDPEILFKARSNYCGANNFFPDNPARAFIDDNNQVHLLDNNSNGYYQMTGKSLNGPFQADCAPLLTSVTFGTNQKVNAYQNYTWIMSSWIDEQGKIIALVHDEFHGEKFGTPSAFCNINQRWQLPECQYWNIVAATSDDQGQTFQKIVDANGNAQATIVSPYPYDASNTNLQGMVAQTNIFENPQNHKHYVLVANNVMNDNAVGVCLFQEKNPTQWLAWDGNDFTISMNQNPYKPQNKNFDVCKNLSTLPGGISITSVSFHMPTQQFILTAETKSWPAPNSKTTDAFIYFTSKDLIHWSKPGLIMPINWWDKWFPNCSVIGEAYPSLLDPTSLGRNFDNSSASPYLYYTRLNANQGGCRVNNNGNDRDLVRVRLLIQTKM